MKRSKLELNFKNQKIRHHWEGKKQKCDCGSKKRVWVRNGWICEQKLIDDLNKEGYSISKNFNTGSVGVDSNAERTEI